jgi:hypothetical protein
MMVSHIPTQSIKERNAKKNKVKVEIKIKVKFST